MKKAVMFVLVGVLLLGFVVAQNSTGNGSNMMTSDNEGANGNKIGVDNGEVDNNGMTLDVGNRGLGQIIRKNVRAGIYTNKAGGQIRVRELARNRLLLMAGNVSVDCNDCNITGETIRNRKILRVMLSNGRNAEIKVMPETASVRALEKLRLKNCNETRNCTIMLKEIGVGNNKRLVYETRAEKIFRLFGLFRIKRGVETQIDAETGEEVMTKRPWWSFLAREREE